MYFETLNFLFKKYLKVYFKNYNLESIKHEFDNKHLYTSGIADRKVKII